MFAAPLRGETWNGSLLQTAMYICPGASGMSHILLLSFRVSPSRKLDNWLYSSLWGHFGCLPVILPSLRKLFYSQNFNYHLFANDSQIKISPSECQLHCPSCPQSISPQTLMSQTQLITFFLPAPHLSHQHLFWDLLAIPPDTHQVENSQLFLTDPCPSPSRGSHQVRIMSVKLLI